MGRGRDPVSRAADDDRDLQGVSEWEPRSAVDRLAAAVHAGLGPLGRLALVLFGLLLLLGLFAGGVLAAVTDPAVGALVALSAVPALLLAAYVRRADVTTGEPLALLAATFVLAVLFASFAGVLNDLGSALFDALAGAGAAEGSLAAAVGGAAFFFLVVGPVEEAVKLLAVWLYAYRSSRFDAVVDGAVYGAAAGLGFATIENALYITRELGPGTGIPELAGVTAVRALAGPGHVIYSAIAGYYLGLAKFNRDHAGALVVKGLLVAAVAHGAYNTLVGEVPFLVADLTPLSIGAAFVGFVVVYDGLVGFYLYRKLRGYRRAYHAVDAGGTDPGEFPAELTEFERGVPLDGDRPVADGGGGDGGDGGGDG